MPLDLGGNLTSGIMAHALDRLRRHLGLEERPVKVHEVFQMLGDVEPDVVERLGLDVLPVEPPVQFFGLRREGWKPWPLWDGTRVLVPGQFAVEVGRGRRLAPARRRRPGRAGGGAHAPRRLLLRHARPHRLASPAGPPPPLEQVRREHRFGAEELEHLQARAELLRAHHGQGPVPGLLGLHRPAVGGQHPRLPGLMLLDPSYVRDLFAVRTETALENLGKLAAHLGDSIDVVGLDGTDYGAQNRELFAPGLFAELYVPFFRAQNDWIHRHTGWKSFLHSCGSIPRLLPLLVEAGVDILNPVQTSAAGMDPGRLKREFGGRLVFWGGGVDTQRTLPFGTPGEVRREVRERVRAFAPGGGFVFNPIHNVQQGTPPENVAAAFDAARTAGVYPIG